MSEENKDVYEVGIPIDELPPAEPSPDGEIRAVLPDNASETPGESPELPDLFDPEELAAAGLTADLVESIEDGEEDEGSLPGVAERSAASENPADIPEQETFSAPATPGYEGLDAELAAPGQDIENASFSETGSTAAEGQNTSETDTVMPFADDDGMEIHAADNARNLVPPVDSDIPDQDLLVDRLESLSLQIAELQREFEGKLKYDAHKDEIIDRLHSELQEYKQNILKKYVLSIVMDVVKVADDIRKWLTYFRSLEVSQRDPRKLFRYLEAIPSDLEDVFYWHGVKPFSSQEGPFDPSRQRAIKNVSTDDPTIDKSVAYSLRPGYEWETKVVRQEMVAVYVHQEAQESTNTRIIDE